MVNNAQKEGELRYIELYIASWCSLFGVRTPFTGSTNRAIISNVCLSVRLLRFFQTSRAHGWGALKLAMLLLLSVADARCFFFRVPLLLILGCGVCVCVCRICVRWGVYSGPSECAMVRNAFYCIYGDAVGLARVFMDLCEIIEGRRRVRRRSRTAGYTGASGCRCNELALYRNSFGECF